MPYLHQGPPATSVLISEGQSCRIRLAEICLGSTVEWKTWSMVLFKSWSNPGKTLDMDGLGLESVPLWVGARCVSDSQAPGWGGHATSSTWAKGAEAQGEFRAHLRGLRDSRLNKQKVCQGKQMWDKRNTNKVHVLPQWTFTLIVLI